MATLVLTALGTAIGGPIGGAIGAFVGRQADQALFMGGNRSGPRLKELSVTTSSYGQAIPRQLGRMRTAGTVIWSTELVESRSTEGGGKGQPSTTTYSYSASFAVAVSSSPITMVRRIWADGKLLRGQAGDLKVEGRMRTYLGHGDDPVDPLIAADKGTDAPAFRDCAYVVFEDLQLADFGNRIPALTFEVIGLDDGEVRMDRLVPGAAIGDVEPTLPFALGFADEGGALSGTLAAIERIYPLNIAIRPDGLTLSTRLDRAMSGSLPVLPERLAQDRDGRTLDQRRQSDGSPDGEAIALRYYDEGRDYQPGVQRAFGSRPEGRESMLDIPAAMSADDARLLANSRANRARWHHERVSWLCREIRADIEPGSLVRIPDRPGTWLVRSWEWHEGGIELRLERLSPDMGQGAGGDAGATLAPNDEPVPETILSAVELPSDGTASGDEQLLFAAASAANSSWRGATLYVEQGNGLLEIGKTGRKRSAIATLAEPLPPGQPHLLEPASSIVVEMCGEGLLMQSSDVVGMASGLNRVLIGCEVIQYLAAEMIDPRHWRLSGIIRGRAGTESAALSGHPAGSDVLPLDDSLTRLDPARVGSVAGTRIAAIGCADSDPVFAELRNAGMSRKPIVPVHPKLEIDASQTWHFGWTRRARGHWRWEDLVDVPLVEEREEYLVGFGSVDSPFITWLTSMNAFDLAESDRAQLLSDYGPAPLWVRQVGTHSHSDPLLLADISS